MHAALFALLTLVLSVPFGSGTSYAWSERGHDLVTRVAVRTLAERLGKERALTGPLLMKEHMLAHLANVPDTLWRSQGKEIEDVNGPTHFLDLEYVSPAPDYSSLPKSMQELEQRMRELCAKPPKDYRCPAEKVDKVSATLAGTAPFRVRQLFNLMRASLEKAGAADKGKEGNGKEFVSAVNDALLHAGIMSHFIGDLANPHHTTRDYNGYENGQGGIHAFFETDVVNVYDMGLDAEVFKATQKKPFARLAKQLPAADKSALEKDPLAIAYALTLDSFAGLNELNELDRKHAVTKPGTKEKGMKGKAERKDAAEVAAHFRPLVVDRLAMAADTLAALWLLAWEQAGKPDLSKYQSYDYQMTPAFIQPDYPAKGK